MTNSYRFETNWKIVLLVLLTLPVLLRLGFWQLERAEEKLLLQETFMARQEQPPQPLAGLEYQLQTADASSIAWSRVSLQGRPDIEKTVLLDNRIRDGIAGYEVLQPVYTESGHYVLVNRGWMAGFADRSRLPQPPPLPSPVRLTGLVYVPAGKPVLLAPQELADSWPLVVQWLDIERIGTLLGRPLFPYSVRLESGQPGTLRTDWAPVNTGPEKHQGYALQWFMMATALFVFWLFLSFRRPSQGGDSGDKDPGAEND